jgi:hypothetical protein
MKRFSGNPLKKPNSIGVKKEEYTAHNSINIVHARYNLHYFNCNVSYFSSISIKNHVKDLF